MRRLRGLVIVAATLLLVCCSTRPKGVLSEKKMASLIADLELAEAFVGIDYDYSSDSLRRTIFQTVLKDHGVTIEQYDTTIRYYGYNIDEYSGLLNKAYVLVQKKEKRMEGATGDIEVSEIASGLWPYRNYMLISPLMSSPELRFSVSDKEIGKGETLVWKYRMSENRNGGNVILGVDYDDGSTAYTTNVGQSQGAFTEVKFQTDTAKTVKRIFGRVSFPGNRSYLMLDSISLATLPFDKDAYRYNSGQRAFNRPKPKAKVDKDSLNADSPAKDSARSNDTILSKSQNLSPKPGRPDRR